jgi:nucleoside-triphosphatase THEP1
MPEPGVYILTAPVQTGKTTSLVNWSAKRNDVYGILTPVVDGKRVFMNAHTKEQFPMEAVEGEKEVLSIGRFVFSKNNFEKAIQIILNAINKEGWLVIDEIGPMELRGEGFHNILKEVVLQRKGKIILVVREGLTEKVKTSFNIPAAALLKELNDI